MKSDSDSDLTLYALGRLPDSDARDLAARLAADPLLAAKLRELEDTMAATWYAASPLVPTPAGSFEAVRAHLRPARRLPRAAMVMAMAGWAAAVVLAVILARRPTFTPEVARGVPASSVTRAVEQISVTSTPLAPRIAARSDDQQLHDTIRRLQHELAMARRLGGGPRIRQLRAPDSSLRGIASDPSRELHDLIAAALADRLARQSETSVALTVESGWLGEVFAELPQDALIRHRNLTPEDAEALGLLRDEGGAFFDPASSTLWTPAEDGGGYLGRKVDDSFDPSTFFHPDPADPGPSPENEVGSESSGYVLLGSEGEESTLLIGNLDLAEGFPPLLVSVDGGLTTQPLAGGQIWQGAGGSGFGIFPLPQSVDGTSLTVLQPNATGSLSVILTADP